MAFEWTNPYTLSNMEIYHPVYIYNRGKFESGTSDFWTDAAAGVRAVTEEKSQKRKRQKRKESVERRSRHAKKRQEVIKKHGVFFLGFVASEDQK